jgi:hypothetical protein
MTQTSGQPDRSRRGALKKIGLGAGVAATLPVIQPGGVARAAERCCAPMNSGAEPAADAEWKPLFFDEHQNETVVALTELIIPATDTPGAKAAQVNRYLDLVLNESEPDHQAMSVQGLAWIDARSLTQHGKPFIELTTEQQTALLGPLADPANNRPEDQTGVRFFEHLKDATIFAYYTSQIGLEQELHYGGDDYHNEYPGACTHREHQS